MKTKTKMKDMETEIYSIVKLSGASINDLVKDGDNILKREAAGLPPVQGNDKGDAFKFRQMTEEEAFVYGTLFPSQTDTADYKDYVPSEAVDALIEFERTCPFKIKTKKVWHAKVYDPDPLFVVETYEKEDRSWDLKTWIVARWGDALVDFDILKVKAKKIWISEERKVLAKIKNEISVVEAMLKQGEVPDSKNHSYSQIARF